MRERRLPKLFFLTGLFLICMCILMLQIAETRLLSVIAWYYLAFFAISMAMFGMTAGSLVVHFKAALFTQERLFEHLPWISLALALSVVASVISLVSSVVFTGLDSGLMILLWLKLILSILPPYFFAGMAISLALTRSRYPVGQVYGVDLVGGAAGCLTVLGLLSCLDGCSVLFAIAAIAALAAAAFRAAWRADAPSHRPPGISNSLPFRYPLALAVAFAALAILNNAIQPYGIRPIVVKDYLEKQMPAAQQWNSFSRIRAEHETTGEPALAGPSPKVPQLEVSQRFMAIDGSASTVMYRFDGNLKDLDFLRYDVTNLALWMRNQGRAAIIGVGGGRDLLSAYLFGFRDVIGVELNPIFVNFLEHRFRDYSHLADLPGIRLHVDEARSWFARTGQKFDFIGMSLVDTWAATGAGAFSLSENGLYTVEGWQHFLKALTADGVFTVSRWYSPDDIRETARLLSLAVSSLRLQGKAYPDKHIVLASAGHLATIIVSRAPFSADDLGTLHEVCAMLGFTILVSPDQPAAAPVLDEVMNANTPEAVARLVRTNHIDVRAPKDDRPFFFNQLVLTDLESLKDGVLSSQGVIHGNMQAAKTIGIIVVLSLALVLVTMIGPSLPAVRKSPVTLAALGTIYFALIGLGFMFVEISIIQRISLILGYPTYGLAIGLFSIILSTGIGSLASECFPLTTPQRIVGWAALLALLIVLLTASFPMLAQRFESEGLAVRALAVLIATVPSGFLMGFGFPTGMGLVNAIDTRPTPWFWAVNGSAGVLAAGAAVGVSIAFSINVSLWVGAACYIALAPISVALRNFGATAIAKQPSIQPGRP